ncbi:1D-myo-inositol 2-acetamido-2-deoxy-alpha-D-glucopyranoside deacetylase [Dermacoccus nishinomiyaensis]|nr:mycothiol conjugate amidase Mca [Dermacoccus nishinomiyaensis]STD71341.1 1D-myo-inositol 2-acetamido-2-deoxy-alpha-D-glucopyranoside deacetylase [Dermacoccus nishinomiyaensis]
MAVHAHPDDESSKGAATMARYLAEGDDVTVVTCTGGERGDVLNPRLVDDPQVKSDLVALRRAEMAKAREVVGFEHVWLGFVDSGLPEGDPLPPLPDGCFALEPLDITVEALVRVIRERRPHVVTTYDENGGYPHPDHIMTHVVTIAAVRAAGDPDAYPHAGAPWQPLKVYYDRTFTRAKLSAYHEALVKDGRDSPYPEWLERRSDRPEGRVTTRVRCDEWFDVRSRALLAHATQIDPDGMFFALDAREQGEAWPTEEWDLALSAVPLTPDEDDLFAGLGSPEQADALATSGAVTMVIDDVVERKEH